ncbi:hypothetical protein [Vibrio sp.]|uniref:hypothetical protein n=1 Tax=Vibrio sp. TaxID=678 RepID=UPI003D1067EE
MRHGMLSALLLSLSLVVFSPLAASLEMSSASARQWLSEPQIQDKVSGLYRLAQQDKLDALQFALQRLAMPQQEVARFLLLQKMEQQRLILTPAMAKFVETQRAIRPTYQVFERGDSYEFTVPAFNFPAIASRLLKQWQQDEATLAFVLQAEQHELVLEHWLTGSEQQILIKEQLLLSQLPRLSSSAVAALTQQLTETGVTRWLPSNRIMVALASVSRDPEMYKLLWLMRADHNSEQEVRRLAEVGDDFALEQLMKAVANPSLKAQALSELVAIKPMSQPVKDFLLTRMASYEDASLVANELASQGYRSWLKELLQHDGEIKTHAIVNALSQ